MSPKNKKAPSGGGGTAPGPNLDVLEKLLGFMSTHGLEEFEYQHGDLHIRFRKAGAAPATHAAPWMLPSPPMMAPVPGGAAGASAPAAETGGTADEEELHVVKSPIVGTFYAAPSPGASPFVKVGDMVAAGQVVCIVEAMKLMNEIEADVAGEVVKVLVEDGNPVEYGQGLFALRPAKGKG